MGNQDMRTPKWLFDFLSKRFGPFDLDAAATAENTLCGRFYTEEDNALLQPWEGKVFCNPPFRDMYPWIRKALGETVLGTSTLMIAPVGCSQKWWHTVRNKSRIRVYYPTKRINFDLPDGSPTSSADRDTIFLWFSPRVWLQQALSEWHCAQLDLDSPTKA
jgi:phage N-6-adenine-methyltransferase